MSAPRPGDAAMQGPARAGRRAGTVARWLCGRHAEHSRFLDMRRLLAKTHWNGLTIGLTTVVTSFWAGPWLLSTVVGAHVVIAVGVAVDRRTRLPKELVVATGFVAMQVVMASAVLLGGGVSGPMLPLMLLPLFSQGLCFRPPVLVAGAAITLALGAAASWGALLLPHRQLPGALHLMSFLALALTLTVVARWLASADLRSRDDAEVDPLTGLFNRKGLASWFHAMRAESAALDGSLSLVLLDIDHFKQVNDVHGHDRGDRVLQELARRMGDGTRGDRPVFRLGGEEFLLLLPATDAEGAVAIAQRMLGVVSRSPVAGLALTVSAGVAVADRPASASLPELMRAADEALYAAKYAGRNRVRLADALPAAAVPSDSAAARRTVPAWAGGRRKRTR